MDKAMHTSKTLQAASIAQMPTKTTYRMGETEVDLSEGYLNLIFTDGTVEKAEMKADGDVSLVNAVPGRGCISFTCQGKPIVFPIEVLPPAVVVGVELAKMPNQTEYTVGDKWANLEGAELLVHFNDGTRENIVVSADMLGPYDFSKKGPSSILIMHQGFAVTCIVTVLEASETREQPTEIQVLYSEPVPTEPEQCDTTQKDVSGQSQEAQKGPAQSNEPDSLKQSAKEVPDFYVSTFGLRFPID